MTLTHSRLTAAGVATGIALVAFSAPRESDGRERARAEGADQRATETRLVAELTDDAAPQRERMIIGGAPAPMMSPFPPDSTVHVACFGPDADPAEMAAVNAHLWQTFLETNPEGMPAYFLGPHWSPSIQGNPHTLRWSVVPDSVFIPSSPNIGEPGGNSILQAQLPVIFGSFEEGLDRIRLCFNRWEQQTGIDFIEVTDDGAPWGAAGPNNGGSNRGDIRVSMKPFNSQSPLAYAGFPDAGDIVINGNILWGLFDGNNYRYFRNTLTHEIGHAIGLMHACPDIDTKLMEPTGSPFDTFEGPQHDDLLGGQRHYGDRFEDNNVSIQATDLGSPTNSFTSLVSIDDNADADFFQFAADANKQVSVHVIPRGQTYPIGPQMMNGDCPAGENIDTIGIHDLQFQLTDGSTTLALVNEAPAGVEESLTDFVLPASGGTFFIRVFGSSVNDIQLYDIEVIVEDAPGGETCTGDLNDSDSVNAADLALLLGAWGDCEDCPSDLNDSGSVNAADLALLLGAWGDCDA